MYIDPNICKEGETRLVGGKTAREGDVQVCHQGLWEYVCGCKWGDEHAKVVCQQLNYSKTGEGEHPANLFTKSFMPMINSNTIFPFCLCSNFGSVFLQSAFILHWERKEY